MSTLAAVFSIGALSILTVLHNNEVVQIHLTHLSSGTQLGGTCVLIGCSQRWLGPDKVSNQRGRRGATWLQVLDPREDDKEEKEEDTETER